MTALFTIKNWIFVEVQSKACEYNRTLVWDNAHSFNGHRECADHKNVWGTVLKETEKAMQIEFMATRFGEYANFENVALGM